MDLDDTMCYCFHVSKRKILRYVERERPERASQISSCLSAGTGCGWCVPYIEKLHREVLETGGLQGEEQLTAAEYEAQRTAYLRTGARPAHRL